MDFLSKRITAIRNGSLATRSEVKFRIPNGFTSSFNKGENFKLILSSLKVLRREGFIRGFKITANASKKEIQYIVIYLKYDSSGNQAIRSIFRISTPGRRVYVNSQAL